MAVTVGDVLAGSATLHVTDCPTCGCVYAIPDGVHRMGLKHKASHTIYCPSGHPWHYTGTTHAEEVRQLRDNLAAARARRDQAEEGERMARMREAKAEKARKRLADRAAAGVCPCCHRTFKQLARHMDNKHPEYRKG
jgi:hypothetical protein